MKTKAFIVVLVFLSAGLPSVAWAQTETIDELYKKALKEEGVT